MKFTNKELSLLGASLYVCEGNKARIIKRTGQKIFAEEFTNANPNIIKVFMKFLRLIIQTNEKDSILNCLFIRIIMKNNYLITGQV